MYQNLCTFGRISKYMLELNEAHKYKQIYVCVPEFHTLFVYYKIITKYLFTTNFFIRTTISLNIMLRKIVRSFTYSLIYS